MSYTCRDRLGENLKRGRRCALHYHSSRAKHYSGVRSESAVPSINASQVVLMLQEARARCARVPLLHRFETSERPHPSSSLHSLSLAPPAMQAHSEATARLQLRLLRAREMSDQFVSPST